jgi:hypothetical protein
MTYRTTVDRWQHCFVSDFVRAPRWLQFDRMSKETWDATCDIVGPTVRLIGYYYNSIDAVCSFLLGSWWNGYSNWINFWQTKALIIWWRQESVFLLWKSHSSADNVHAIYCYIVNCACCITAPDVTDSVLHKPIKGQSSILHIILRIYNMARWVKIVAAKLPFLQRVTLDFWEWWILRIGPRDRLHAGYI